MQTLIDFKDFIPHGYCLGWNSSLLWLTVISDAVMTLAYATYPIGIAYFVWKRKDLQYRWLYLTFFNAFILTCASTHFLSLLTIWIPLYWLEACVKAVAATVATATVFAIWWVIPRALKLPSPAELQKARDQAEAANKAKSIFLANMSHELRTPLNAILGFSELMSRDSSISPAQKETLNIINRSGTHLLSMINDVLDISKIEAGRFELDIHAFALHKLLHEIADMVTVRTMEKQLSFRLEIASDIPRYIESDSGKLRQILINLLGNAIKFTQQGGVILRACSHPLATPEMLTLTLEVADSGTGIAEHQQQELFKPFVQLGQDDSNIQGTGLGLAISKALVELMQGSIRASSTLGVGSTFRVELPIHIAEAKHISTENNPSPVKGLAPNQAVKRLLIVDDNFENRLLLATLLKKVGFALQEAENGQEAIDKFQQWQPDLIWMDMRMPVMDGYEATRRIRQLPNGNAVKIIALTASAFKEQHIDIINAGCEAVLHKPFRAPEIFAALTKYLGVKFIYQDNVPNPALSIPKFTPATLNVVPEPLKQQLYQAALNLDTEETDAIISQIHAITPEVAEILQQLAAHYQFEQIIQLTDSAEKTVNSTAQN
jgi:signal transduction histidine kinase/DNA-binding response OmpR family regulator